MFKALLKARFLSVISGFFKKAGSKKKASSGKMAMFVILGLYLFVCFFYLFYSMFDQMCEPFHMFDIDWLYFAIAAMTAMALMFIGSVFTTQSQLYMAKDNELLLSMPIPPKYILATRMIALLGVELLFEVIVFLPVSVVYQKTVGFTGAQVVILVLTVILLSFLVLAFSCIIGWLITVLSSRVRNKSLITVTLSVIFLLFYFYFYSKLNRYIQELVSNGQIIASKIKGAAAPIYWIGSSIAKPNAEYTGLIVLCTLVPFAIVYAVLAKSFIRIATTKHGFAKIEYHEKTAKEQSVPRALLQKEWKHFLSSPMYILNSSLGVLFTVIGVVAFIVKKDVIINAVRIFPQVSDNMGIFLALALCAVSTVNIISAPSISLEGKTLWILRSCPVDTIQILNAKMMLHLVIALPPVVFGSIAGIIIFDLSLGSSLIVLTLPVMLNIFIAVFGLIVNLHLPKFDWISEAVAVKQSASVIVAMFGSMAVVMIPAFLYGLVLVDSIKIQCYTGILTILFAMIDILLYHYLITKGKIIFEKL